MLRGYPKNVVYSRGKLFKNSSKFEVQSCPPLTGAFCVRSQYSEVRSKNESYKHSAISFQHKIKQSEILQQDSDMSFRKPRQRISGIQFLHFPFLQYLFLQSFNPSILNPAPAISKKTKTDCHDRRGRSRNDHVTCIPRNPKLSSTQVLCYFATLLLCHCLQSLLHQSFNPVSTVSTHPPACRASASCRDWVWRLLRGRRALPVPCGSGSPSG